nr:MAG TPA: hypothetical protein [Caudoviricetes sp.]
MQKKRVARGAFAHINRKRGGCSLPSDTLTEKQRKEKNGEVKSYNITRPMPWREFKPMPEDLKREFFRNMQSFGGTAKWLAEEMNVCDATIRRESELVGAPFRRGGRNEKMWQSKVTEWANADAVDIHTADAQSEGGHVTADVLEGKKPQVGAKLLHARLEMSGDREALLANLRVLLPDEGQVTVEW